jgi:cytochrome c oxidase subunit 2
MVGPTFRGVFGSTATVRAGDKESDIVVNEEYLVKSIQEPMTEILKGYPPVMPPNPLSETELEHVIDYLRNLQ